MFEVLHTFHQSPVMRKLFGGKQAFTLAKEIAYNCFLDLPSLALSLKIPPISTSNQEKLSDY